MRRDGPERNPQHSRLYLHNPVVASTSPQLGCHFFGEGGATNVLGLLQYIGQEHNSFRQ